MRKFRGVRARGFTMIELMMVMAIIGILAAVAIPSFVRYSKRARSVEAGMNLRRMYDGAVAYYLGEHADSSGILQRRFPNTIGPTPATVPPGIKVLVLATAWDVPEWQALNFQISDPIVYSYAFTSSGVGLTAFATMWAMGDLDGDGNVSQFSRTCMAVNDGVRGGSGMHVVDELE